MNRAAHPAPQGPELLVQLTVADLRALVVEAQGGTQLALPLLPANPCSRCAAPALFDHGGLSFCREHGAERLRLLAGRSTDPTDQVTDEVTCSMGPAQARC